MKRLFDITLAILLLIITAPLMLITAVMVLIFLGRPVFFIQLRPGINGKPFRLYKFRSMKNIQSQHDSQLNDEQRLTWLGKKLRASSIDELPELWNVLKGDMSMVGPRPLLMEYLPLYSEVQYRRHEVRPGLTGWAQINGRNSVDWNERLAMDVWYVDNRNMWLDLQILLKTVAVVLKSDGVSQDGQATMKPFQGNKQ